jgi:hypothetical protein
MNALAGTESWLALVNNKGGLGKTGGVLMKPFLILILFLAACL